MPSNSLEIQGYRIHMSGSPWERYSAALGLGSLSAANGNYRHFLIPLPPLNIPLKYTLFDGV